MSGVETESESGDAESVPQNPKILFSDGSYSMADNRHYVESWFTLEIEGDESTVTPVIEGDEDSYIALKVVDAKEDWAIFLQRPRDHVSHGHFELSSVSFASDKPEVSSLSLSGEIDALPTNFTRGPQGDIFLREKGWPASGTILDERFWRIPIREGQPGMPIELGPAVDWALNYFLFEFSPDGQFGLVLRDTHEGTNLDHLLEMNLRTNEFEMTGLAYTSKDHWHFTQRRYTSDGKFVIGSVGTGPNWKSYPLFAVRRGQGEVDVEPIFEAPSSALLLDIVGWVSSQNRLIYRWRDQAQEQFGWIDVGEDAQALRRGQFESHPVVENEHNIVLSKDENLLVIADDKMNLAWTQVDGEDILDLSDVEGWDASALVDLSLVVDPKRTNRVFVFAYDGERSSSLWIAEMENGTVVARHCSPPEGIDGRVFAPISSYKDRNEVLFYFIVPDGDSSRTLAAKCVPGESTKVLEFPADEEVVYESVYAGSQWNYLLARTRPQGSTSSDVSSLWMYQDPSSSISEAQLLLTNSDYNPYYAYPLN